MEMFTQSYFTKSFMSIGNSLSKCYNCQYCRVMKNSFNNYSSIFPTDLNPVFDNIPVAINLFYGDPFLQTSNTYKILEELEKRNHKGPVVIITKGIIPKNFPKFNLDIHFGLSTFGIDSQYDGSTLNRFYNNLDTCSELPYKYSIEYRPIIKGINDSDECIERVIKKASEHNIPIGYCGLQLSPDLDIYLKENNIVFESYPGVDLSMKKYLPESMHKTFRDIANEYNVNIFKKTSCMLAFIHGKERDFNAHYYRPNEVGCYNCPMKEKCFGFKENNNAVKIDIPFDYKLVEKENHICTLYKQGICKFPSYDCKNIKGKLIHIDEKITTSDVRLIKWLTGFTVDADFTEEPYISEKWVH